MVLGVINGAGREKNNKFMSPFWDPTLTFSSLGMLDHLKPVGQFGGEMETTSRNKETYHLFLIYNMKSSSVTEMWSC